MHKLLFVCHGNICRSPMAEFIMKKLVEDENQSTNFLIDSKAATNDAQGHGMDFRTIRTLEKHNIPYTTHIAQKMTKEDYAKYDYLICMDEENFMDMNQITGGDPDKKEVKLLQFADSLKDIDDPWYTNDFEKSYQEISAGCRALLKKLI